MRKVLIPTDFSDNSQNAINYAMELFKYDRTDFYIMHAYGDEVYQKASGVSREEIDKVKAEVLKESESMVAELVDRMKKRTSNPKHTFYRVSVFGSLVDEANEYAERENVDIIVMGTRGRTDDRDITFGSNTLQVIKYVKCPVLAIPSNYKDIQPTHALFATDYMLPYQRRELKLLSTTLKNFAARLTVLHISKFAELSYRQQDNQAFLEYCMEEIKPNFVKLAGSDVPSTIAEAIGQYKADILVMINSRHSYLENVLYTSKIEKIGLDVDIPFLVLQNLPRN
jgi:nucleotide-binding universal stress UspA family protein